MSLITKEVINGDVIILYLKGDVLGGPQASELNDRLHQLVDNGKHKIVLDLSAVAFMNSSGLGMLIGGMTTVKNAGGHLKLANPAERIQSLLVITKLANVFQTFPSVDAAVESFTS